MPQSKAGFTALRTAFYDALGIVGECEAEREENFRFVCGELLPAAIAARPTEPDYMPPAPRQTAPAAPPIFAPAAPADLLTLKPYAPWTRATFLHNVRAHSLRRADELEAIARDFKGLPATAGIMLLGETGVPINLPAFVPSAEWRAEGIARAAAMRAEYADPTWMPRQLARWEMTGAENPQPARRAAA